MRYGNPTKPTGRRLCWLWLFVLMAVVLGVWAVVANASDIHYTPWLTFTDDTDRERQIDSVGAIEVYRKVVFEGEIDSFWVATGYTRQIAFVEIREWPGKEIDWEKYAEYLWNEGSDVIPTVSVPGTFRVAWKEE